MKTPGGLGYDEFCFVFKLKCHDFFFFLSIKNQRRFQLTEQVAFYVRGFEEGPARAHCSSGSGRQIRSPGYSADKPSRNTQSSVRRLPLAEGHRVYL